MLMENYKCWEVMARWVLSRNVKFPCSPCEVYEGTKAKVFSLISFEITFPADLIICEVEDRGCALEVD